jgi:hypothetical protein
MGTEAALRDLWVFSAVEKLGGEGSLDTSVPGFAVPGFVPPSPLLSPLLGVINVR